MQGEFLHLSICSTKKSFVQDLFCVFAKVRDCFLSMCSQKGEKNVLTLLALVSVCHWLFGPSNCNLLVQFLIPFTHHEREHGFCIQSASVLILAFPLTLVLKLSQIQSFHLSHRIIIAHTPQNCYVSQVSKCTVPGIY